MSDKLKDINTCTGCSACTFVCKHGAIAMKESKEGFLFPVVDEVACVKCGMCVNICNKHAERDVLKIQNTLAFQATDKYMLFNSSSGGVVPTIAKLVIERGGVYATTKYSPSQGGPYWDLITSQDDINNSSGSKYFQIPLNRAFIDRVLTTLKTQVVLFVGTPCQVAAIKKVAPRNLISNLITIDLICGGVQSYKLEKLYLESLEHSFGNKVISHKFRGKDRGWKRKYLSVISFSDGSRQLKFGSKDLFQRAFSSGSYLRASCYQCEYIGRDRVGDITVGDCWGIEKVNNTPFEYAKGISIVGFNTEKGFGFLKGIKDNGITSPITEEILAENKPLNKRNKRPKTRSISYKLINVLPIEQAVNVICYKYAIKKLIGRG